jgi:hypothetical protein
MGQDVANAELRHPRTTLESNMRNRCLFFAAWTCLVTGTVAWTQPGPPPGGGITKPGQIVPEFLQDSMKLTAEQKKELEQLQKDVEPVGNRSGTAR